MQQVRTYVHTYVRTYVGTYVRIYDTYTYAPTVITSRWGFRDGDTYVRTYVSANILRAAHLPRRHFQDYIEIRSFSSQDV